jgi:hypothetical protein
MWVLLCGSVSLEVRGKRNMEEMEEIGEVVERRSYFQSARYGPNSVTRFTSASSDLPVVKSGVCGVGFAILLGWDMVFVSLIYMFHREDAYVGIAL